MTVKTEKRIAWAVLVAILALMFVLSNAHAQVAISALPDAAAIGGTEQVPAVQSAATVKTTPAAMATYTRTTATGTINTQQGTNVASAGTINLDTATGNVVDVTGTTTITAVTLSQGRTRIVRFTGALILTNGASLVLPGAANITTAAGDFAVFVGYAAGVVRVAEYQRVAFQPTLTGTFTPTIAGTTSAGTGTYTTQNGTYTVLGNRVFFDLNVIWTATTGTGNTLVQGLPITSNATASTNSVVNCAYNQSNASLITTLSMSRVDPNSTQVLVIGYVAASGSLALPIAASAQLICSGNYKL